LKSVFSLPESILFQRVCTAGTSHQLVFSNRKVLKALLILDSFLKENFDAINPKPLWFSLVYTSIKSSFVISRIILNGFLNYFKKFSFMTLQSFSRIFQ